MRERVHDAAYWIDRLALTPHPEGGYFRETYRAAESVPPDALPARYGGARALSTAIYFLLPAGECSALHRIRSDELWHYYAGDPLTLVTIDDAGLLTTHVLGPEVERGERFQVLAPAGVWFGAEVPDRSPSGGASDVPGGVSRAFTLVGCTVAPGFDFADFELGTRTELVRRYPQHRAVIEHLTPAAPRDNRKLP
jgi:predicted cupin superfamily sugar epimerase